MSERSIRAPPSPPPRLLINYFTKTPSWKANNVIKPGTNADNLLTARTGAQIENLGSRPENARHLEPVVVGRSVTGQGIGCGCSVGVGLGLFVCCSRCVVSRGRCIVGRSRRVVAGGRLGVLLGRGAVRVDGCSVLGIITCTLIRASQEKIGEDGGFQKGDLAKQQPVYKGIVGDGWQSDGTEAGAKEGLGLRVGSRLAIDCDGQTGCEDEVRDLHFSFPR